MQGNGDLLHGRLVGRLDLLAARLRFRPGGLGLLREDPRVLGLQLGHRPGEGRRGREQLGDVDALGQQAQTGGVHPPGGGVDGGDRLAHAVAEGFGVALAVDARQGEQHLVGVHVEAAARPVHGDVLLGVPVDDGRRLLVDAELDLRAEQGLDVHAQVEPPPRAHHQVDAVVEGPLHHPAQAPVLPLELFLERRPAVQDQEDVPVPVVGPAGRPQAPVIGHRVDAVLAEVDFPVLQDRLDLGQHTAGALGVAARRDPGDVRQAPHRGESAAEVQHVELDLQGRGGERQRHDQAAQRRGLARHGAPHDDAVALRAGEVVLEGLLLLLARQVDHPHGDAEGPFLPPRLRHESEPRVGRQVPEEHVEGRRVVQGLQPDLVRGQPVALHAFDSDVELAHVRVPRVVGTGRVPGGGGPVGPRRPPR